MEDGNCFDMFFKNFFLCEKKQQQLNYQLFFKTTLLQSSVVGIEKIMLHSTVLDYWNWLSI